MRLKMRYVSLVLLVCFLALALPGIVFAEDDPILTDPNRMWADVVAGSGSVSKSVLVTNTSVIDRTVTVSWDYYTGPVGDEIFAKESWFNLPPSQLLPAGMPWFCIVTVKIPVGTEPLKYKAYIKVADDRGYYRHVVVWVRVGTAVPTYEYGITQGLYDATLTEPGIGQCDVPNFGINNTGTTECDFRVFCELPNGESDPSYEVAPYSGEGDSISYDWVTIDADIKTDGIQDIVSIPAYELGWAKIKLEVPEDVPNGKYKMWIGVKIAEETGQTIGIGYASKIRLVVNRRAATVIGESVPWYESKYFGPGLIIGLFLSVGLGYVVVNSLKNRKETKVPEYRIPNGR